jgi:syntaxin 7
LTSLTFRVTAQELDFQETLIAEREAEIRDIESGIHELNDIFRDLGTIVSEQSGLIGELRPGAQVLVRRLTSR